MGTQAKPQRRPSAASASAPPQDVREVLNSLRRIVRTLRVSSRTAEQAVGLTGAQLFVLQCLARHSPCSVNELAARTATDQSSVSVVVSRLVRAGHVLRSPSKHDRRSVELSLTSSGRSLVARAPEAAQDRLIAALGQLTKLELAGLRRLLGKVVEGAEAAEESATLFFEDGPVLVSKGRAKRG
ncbi:MAG: MarR family transcriptional regulator [Myxococcales bacterium]|nr:MAG: MarR family transcriptional regulator [Myxococcales bacterium]